MSEQNQETAEMAEDKQNRETAEMAEDKQNRETAAEGAQGVPLWKYLQDHDVETDEAIRMLRPFLESVGEMHRRGNTCREIDPRDMIVTQEGFCRLADMTELTPAEVEAMGLLLVPGYTPAEGYQVGMRRDPAWDVYSSAAVLYRMITGEKPQEAVNRIVEEELKKPSELGIRIRPGQEKALWKALEPDAKKRTRTMEEFVKELTKRDGAGGGLLQRIFGGRK